MAIRRIVLRAAMVFLMLVAAQMARAQDRADDVAPDAMQAQLAQVIYTRLQDNIRKEYEFQMTQVMRQLIVSGAPREKLLPIEARMKQLSYNKAALMAFCIADAEKDRAPNAQPLPPGMNLMVTTCVEIKLGQMQKFSDLAAYAGFFFPERIDTCGESARVPVRESVLRPYDFLELSEPKLFDFVRYNECLMKR